MTLSDITHAIIDDDNIVVQNDEYALGTETQMTDFLRIVDRCIWRDPKIVQIKINEMD